MPGRPLAALLEEAAESVEPAGESVVDGALGLARRRTRNRRLVSAAAAFTVLVGFGVALSGQGRAPVQVAGGAAPQLPRYVEDHSYLTARVADAPAGRAIAALAYWQEFPEGPSLGIVGADSNSYRTLPEDEGGSPSLYATLLSPDGTVLAAEDTGGILLHDLRTGRKRHLPLKGECCGVRLQGFSPDGATIVVRTVVDAEVSDGTGLAPHLVDVRTGAVTLLDRRSIQSAAFSPDGTIIATSEKGTLRLFDRTGRMLSERPVTGELAGPNAWSPDGRFIATVPASNNRSKPATLTFVPVDASAAPPPPLRVDRFDLLLGWRSEHAVAVGQWNPDRGDLTEFDVRSGRGRVLSSAPVTFDVVAAGLLPDLVITESGGADFGPWPAWARVAAGIAGFCVALLGTLVAWTWTRRARRRRATVR